MRFDTGRDINVYLTVDIPQNHISFKYSSSRHQLAGDDGNIEDLELCGGYYSNEQMNKNVSITGRPLNMSDKAIPCGRMPWLFPLGVLKAYYLQNGTELEISTDGIVSNLSDPFKNVDRDRQWLDMTDPRFRNWMETSPSK